MNVNDKKFSLDSNLLYLDNEYNDIYSMNYIIPDLLEDDSLDVDEQIELKKSSHNCLSKY